MSKKQTLKMLIILTLLLTSIYIIRRKITKIILSTNTIEIKNYYKPHTQTFNIKIV